jgi:hypothetical protein
MLQECDVRNKRSKKRGDQTKQMCSHIRTRGTTAKSAQRCRSPASGIPRLAIPQFPRPRKRLVSHQLHRTHSRGDTGPAGYTGLARMSPDIVTIQAPASECASGRVPPVRAACRLASPTCATRPWPFVQRCPYRYTYLVRRGSNSNKWVPICITCTTEGLCAKARQEAEAEPRSRHFRVGRWRSGHVFCY